MGVFKEKVSIVIPVYNMESYLNRCLDSIINQTYNNLDIIIVNDGSTDDSKNIIDSYAIRDGRIKVINKNNGGYGSTINSALDLIDTKYFLICDADDYLEPNAIEVLFENSNDSDIVCAKYYSVNEGGKYKNNYPTYFGITDNKVFNSYLDRFVFMPVSPHSKLFKTDIIRGIKLPEKTYFTDVLLYYYAINEASTLSYIDEYLSNYYFERDGNTRTDTNPVIFDYHLRIIKEIVHQCNLYNHKYMVLGLLFYNWYVLNQLSNMDKSIIINKKDRIYEMYRKLFPYTDIVENIVGINKSFIDLKNRLLSYYTYEENIDNMLNKKEESYNRFVRELSLLPNK